MKSFVIYNGDGEILRSGVCVDTDFDIQAREGEFILEASCKDTKNHKVVDGQVIYSKRVPTVEEMLRAIRRDRDMNLSKSDWTQVNDAPLTPEKKQEWATYRQQLRDLPSSYENLTEYVEPVFPEPPKG